jgi:putative transposase
LARLTGCTDLPDLQAVHKRWIKGSLQADERERESHWTESIASGSKSFIEKVKQSLDFKAKGKSIIGGKDRYQLREDVAIFGNTSLYGPEPIVRSDAGTTNTILWRDIS